MVMSKKTLDRQAAKCEDKRSSHRCVEAESRVLALLFFLLKILLLCFVIRASLREFPCCLFSFLWVSMNMAITHL